MITPSLCLHPRPICQLTSRVAAVLALTLLASCGTLGKDECLQADWRTIGYEDGLSGQPPSRIGAHRSACAKYQVVPNLDAYNAGRAQGLSQYCQPRNGYRAGVHGHAYHNVCPPPSEPGFLAAFRYGRQIHEVRSELRASQSQLQAARDAIVQGNKAADKVRAELIQPDLTVARRLQLAQQLERLSAERRDREAQIHLLTAQIGQQSYELRELEVRSPYAD